MSAAGYKTFMAGKWDAGMATMDHTPRGRGYSQSIHYFHHDNDYWDSDTGTCDTTCITMMNCVLKPRNCAFKTMNSTDRSRTSGLTATTRRGPHRRSLTTGATRITTRATQLLLSRERSINRRHVYIIGKSCTLGVDGDRWWGGFEDSIFEQHVLGFIEESKPEAEPLFIFWCAGTSSSSMYIHAGD